MIARIASNEAARDIGSSPNKGGPRAFTQQQDAAINLLATGYSVADAAAVLGVSRSILDKWRNRNPAFEQEINRRRQEIGAPARRSARHKNA
ncbi:MAG TPA: helix-turn-helix domain-containing protein [Blastocatellia bacterium]|jgi:transposase|nr:helix-turn-helix domain-containing protein [Blastocatellia bacterium]